MEYLIEFWIRDNGNGGLVKGAPHLHLDYIPVAFNCERGQKVQNSMNGALIEQGIVNIEIDSEIALKKFGIRDKSKKKKSSTQNSPQDISERMQCFTKLESEEASQENEPEKNSSCNKPCSMDTQTKKSFN